MNPRLFLVTKIFDEVTKVLLHLARHPKVPKLFQALFMGLAAFLTPTRILLKLIRIIIPLKSLFERL